MIQQETPFDITVGRQRYTGTVSEFQVDGAGWPTDKPQLRVHIEQGGDKYGQFFQFYRVDEETLFWYDWPNAEKQKLAKHIAEKLINA